MYVFGNENSRISPCLFILFIPPRPKNVTMKPRPIFIYCFLFSVTVIVMAGLEWYVCGNTGVVVFVPMDITNMKRLNHVRVSYKPSGKLLLLL